MQKVLIIGYGKMGKIHGKHLTEMGIEWSGTDPKYAEYELWPKYLGYYTHIIVATPIDTHYDIFKRLHAFHGLILIEKPVVIDRDHLHVLKDSRVMAGLNERYNPVTHYLQSVSDQIQSIAFYRNGSGPFEDAAIHDIDIAFQVLGNDYKITRFNTSRVEAVFNHISVTFTCGPYCEKERFADVMFDNGITTTDFKNQTINDAPLKKCSTVKEELKGFMRGYFGEDDMDTEPIAYHSHKFLVECLEHGVS